MSVAFVRMTGSFINPYPAATDGVLELPQNEKDSTVTSASVFLADGRVFDTMVVDTEATKELKPNAEMLGAIEKYRPNELLAYNPKVFRLPVSRMPPASEITFDISYFQNLFFVAGKYEVTVPLRFPMGMLERPLENTLQLLVDVNTGTPDSDWGSTSHPLMIVPGSELVAPAYGGAGVDPRRMPQRFLLQLAPGHPIPNVDFSLSYRAWSSSILANALVEAGPAAASGAPTGNFCLFLSPPRPDAVGASFGRRITFLIDNSGSMAGRTMKVAAEALVQCLDRLTAADEFAICVFNHQRCWWAGQEKFDRLEQETTDSPDAGVATSLFAATPANLATAKRFVNSIVTTGMTNILTPLQQSFSLLRRADGSSGGGFAGSSSSYGASAVAPGAITNPIGRPIETMGPPILGPSAAAAAAGGLGGMPGGGGGGAGKMSLVFLLTDGSVENDDKICMWVKSSIDEMKRAGQSTPRIFTFGIGQWVNDHFINCLAQLGRGYADFALSTDSLEAKIVRQMSRASQPVLVDILIGLPGVSALEVFPFPIPDLYCGAPVIVSGRYEGPHPAAIHVRGRLPTGAEFQAAVPAFWSTSVPVAKLFARQQLDLLMSGHWLLGKSDPAAAEAQRRRIVDISVGNSVPCPYTTMIGFPTDQKSWNERHPDLTEKPGGAAGAGGAGGAGGGGGGGAAARGGGSAGGGPPGAAASSGGWTTGQKVAVGAAGVVALGATVAAGAALGNALASSGAVSGMVSTVVTVGGGVMGQVLGGLGQAAGTVAGAVGDVVTNCDCCGMDLGTCGGLPGFLDGCFGNVGSCCGDVLGCIPNTVSSIGSSCGDCCSAGGGFFTAVGGMVHGVCDNCGGCIGSMGDCCSTTMGSLSGVLGNCGEAAGSVCGALGGCSEGLCNVLGGCAGALGNVGECLGSVGGCLAESGGAVFEVVGSIAKC